MTIIEKTRELGEMIQESEEMKKVKAAEAAQTEDEDAKTYMLEFNMKSMNLARDMQEGKLTQEEAVKQNNEAFQHMVDSSESIRNYVEAKQELDKLIKQINDMLSFYITGQDPNCTHNCGTCGGCH